MLQEKGQKMWLTTKVVVLPIAENGRACRIGILEPELETLLSKGLRLRGSTSSSDTPESRVLSSAIMVANWGSEARLLALL